MCQSLEEKWQLQRRVGAFMSRGVMEAAPIPTLVHPNARGHCAEPFHYSRFLMDLSDSLSERDVDQQNNDSSVDTFFFSSQVVCGSRFPIRNLQSSNTTKPTVFPDFQSIHAI